MLLILRILSFHNCTLYCIHFITRPWRVCKSFNFLKQMFINCQTFTLFELLTPFFTLFIFTVKHPWRRRSLSKNTGYTFCIYDSDVTKPLFLRNKFWSVIRASRHRISLSLQSTTDSLLQTFSLSFNHLQPSSFNFFTNRRYVSSTPSMRLKIPECL